MYSALGKGWLCKFSVEYGSIGEKLCTEHKKLWEHRPRTLEVHKNSENAKKHFKNKQT